jgi:glycosyltransferase involved in cell wall biosynthesis
VRIAIIAPGWMPVPPAAYGGIELVVGLLTDALVDAAYDVTLFAAPGSETKAELVTTSAEQLDRSLLGNAWYDGYHALGAYLRDDGVDIASFDVVHDHTSVSGALCGAMLRGRPPVVHTLHGPWTAETRLFYRALDRYVHLVAISDAQAAQNPDVRYAAMVHNGIDLAAYPCRTKKADHLVYVGRATPDKGPVEAIQIARRAGRPLKMLLKHFEPPEVAYFERVIEPELGPDVELYEHVSHATKVELLAGAAAMLFPIQWSEPFGLVMAEAMACGTPVVTTNLGAAPELVIDGRTGFRRDTAPELADALGRVDEIDPLACRSWVEERFSAAAMVRGYERVYAQALETFPLRT